MRIDKWLWAARFYKTRSLAAEAVKGGKIQINGQKVKSSKEVEVGDELCITLPICKRTFTILALNSKRRPFKEACLLYEEKPESLSNFNHLNALQKAVHVPRREKGLGRPTKKDRREIDKFRDGE